MATITLHLNLKNSLSFIVGLCVVVLAYIPLFVPVDHLSWLRWQMAAGMAALVALVALFVQACLQSRDDQKRDRDQEETRDLLKKIVEGRVPTAIGSESDQSVSAQQHVAGNKDDLDGELQRVFVYPRIGVPYKLLQEAWTKIGGHSDNPKVDCDIILAMYAVNRSQSVTHFVRDLAASVVVNGVRTDLERLDNFRLDFGHDKLEYGLEKDENATEADPLPPLFSRLPCELPPNKPIEGWVRFVLKGVDPEKIDSNTWMFSLVDSLGIQHPLTKTSDRKKKGEIGFRRADR